MVSQVVMHDVTWNVRIDYYEDLEEVRQCLVRSLQDIERLFDGPHVGPMSLPALQAIQIL